VSTITTTTLTWPSSHDFVEAIQNPRLAFRDTELRDCEPAIDRFGMPVVAAGNFAYAFKLRDSTNKRATGVRCFRGFIPDRDRRYSLIDAHLNAHPNPHLTDFEFDPDGILVGGQRYPIVSMEWIDGPRLDLYVEQILGNKPALNHLADEWLKVIGSLRETQAAHGDLQHGNLIIHNSQFRLIDLDGMFVPAMQGLNSNEIGHLHYQHPLRSFKDFNLGLDKFSSLVIYLSLLALAEAPELWRDFHDENLIFTKPDFVDPHSSKLFAQLRKMGQPIPQLAEELTRAAKAKPGDTPYLLDLATRKSKLPAWMTAPSDIRIEVKTREAGSTSSPPTNGSAANGQSQFTPVWKQQSSAPAGVSQIPQASSVPIPLPQRKFEWSRVNGPAWTNAIKYGFGGLLFFFIWVPLLQGIGAGMGIDKGDIPAFIFWVYAIACVVIGYVTSWKAEQKRVLSTTTPGVPWTQPPPAPWTRTSYTAPSRNTGSLPVSSAQVVGSKIRSIYHRPTCDWVIKMSHRNRITFNSSSAAIAKGYRACRVCRP